MQKALLLLIAMSGCTNAVATGQDQANVESHWAAMAEAPIAGRSAHAAVWTGDSMLVAFGNGEHGPLRDAALYNPDANAWTNLGEAPIAARFMPLTAAIPGGAFILFGATLGARATDGAIFDGGWHVLPTAPIVGRTSAAIIATDRAVVVWGGETDHGFSADGARFDLATHTWSTIAKSPLSARAFHRAVRDGDAMVVYGGIDSSGNVLADAARYDVSSDRWSSLVVPRSIAGRADASASGGFFFGGRAIADGDDGCPHARTDGARFDGVSFTALPAAPLAARADVAAWTSNDKLFLFGGFVCDSVFADGASFDGTSWTALPSGGPSARRGATAVLTSAHDQAIVWGGTGTDGKPLADGARFLP